MRNEPDGYFHWHHDFIVEKNKGARIITFIWYLNNANKEGYTEFCDGTIITPKTGKLLIFPADWMYIHRGRPPKIGRKYICTGWMYLQNNLFVSLEDMYVNQNNVRINRTRPRNN